MKRVNWRIFLGLFLMALGVVSLLQVMNILPTSGSLVGLIFAALFFFGGTAFLSVFVSDRKQWWGLIPGTILVFLGLLIGGSELSPRFATLYGGPFFLAGISLAFWLVYFFARENWWAIIPGGTLLTVAVVAGLSDIAGIEVAGIIFFGLAATFTLVALLTRMTWPWYPAVPLLVIGVLFSISASEAASYIMPAALIVIGVYLLARSFHKSAS